MIKEENIGLAILLSIVIFLGVIVKVSYDLEIRKIEAFESISQCEV